MRKNLITLLITLFAMANVVNAEDYKGKLTLINSDIPVEGIIVKVKGGVKLLTSTNNLGEFNIKSAKYPFKVIFSHKNYEKCSYTVKSESDNSFEITQKVKKNNENIKSQVGPVSISKSDQAGGRSLSLLERLSTVPGVLVRGDIVVIRGVSSITSSSAPLVLVDGIRQVGSIANLNIPSELIKTITVLKGSEAASYGMSGSNGVILIKTASAEQ